MKDRWLELIPYAQSRLKILPGGRKGGGKRPRSIQTQPGGPGRSRKSRASETQKNEILRLLCQGLSGKEIEKKLAGYRNLIYKLRSQFVWGGNVS